MTITSHEVTARNILANVLTVLLLALGAFQDAEAAHRRRAVSPALVKNICELQAIRNNPSGTYVLANDIDAGDFTCNNGVAFQFMSIGNDDTPFSGSFDGGGFAISRLSIKSANVCGGGYLQCAGLFGENSGTISNVRLVELNIDITSLGPVGGLTGINRGVIRGVFLRGTISAAGDDDRGIVIIGGLAGVNEGSISFSQSALALNASGRFGEPEIGGLVGDNFAGIEQSFSTGPIAVRSGSLGGSVEGFIGGLVGSNYGTILYSYSSSIITDRLSGNFVTQDGGLVGGQTGGSISSSSATGSLSGSNALGGLIGGLEGGTVLDSFATGNVTSSAAIVGGFAGAVDTQAMITRSFSTGHVKSTQGLVGGFVGWAQQPANFSNTYWDLHTSGVGDPSKGCGNLSNCSGVVGLATKDFKGKIPGGLNTPDWMQVKFPIRFESIDSQITDYPKLWALSFPITHFPLSGQSPYGSDTTNPLGARITSVFDHSMPWENAKQVPTKAEGVLYRCDDFALAFTGAVGTRKAGTDDPDDSCIAPGYQQDRKGTPFDLGGVNYYGVSGKTWYLNYDGHPGYDYVADHEPVFAATSGILFYPWESVGMTGRSYHAYCFFHALSEVPDSAPTYRLYYLHLSTHPAGVDPNSPPCDYDLGDTKGQTVTISDPNWIPAGCVYRDQAGAPFTPSSLPLPGGTHVEVPPGKQCVIAVSGDAGTIDSNGMTHPHLHVELQQIVPTSALAKGKFRDNFPCFNEDDYEGGRDKKHLCIPVDPYGWTGATTDCSGDLKNWHTEGTDVWVA